MTNYHHLKMMATDGKLSYSDVADLERVPFGAIGSEKYYVCNPTIID